MSANRPLQDIHRAIVELSDRGCDFAVAVVLQAEGSTPCKAGAKALVDAEGAIQGTVGGGLVEAEAQRRAAQAIRMGRPAVFDFRLKGAAVHGAEPICGGTMRFLVDPAAARHRAAYAAAAAARGRRERGVLLTAIQRSDQWQVSVEFHAGPAIPQDLGFPGAEAVRSALEREETRLFVAEPTQGGQPLEVLVEPMVPGPALVIAGGGHVGQAVAAQASLLGFEILVIDDRPEFTDPNLFPQGTATRCGPIGEEIAHLPIGADTYIVIVTRGHQHDAQALEACLHKPAAYIGMIGSRGKVARMRECFIDAARATPEEFDRVYAPIGLDIGSVTVPEIAASIVAQLVAVRRKGAAPRMPIK